MSVHNNITSPIIQSSLLSLKAAVSDNSLSYAKITGVALAIIAAIAFVCYAVNRYRNRPLSPSLSSTKIPVIPPLFLLYLTSLLFLLYLTTLIQRKQHYLPSPKNNPQQFLLIIPPTLFLNQILLHLPLHLIQKNLMLSVQEQSLVQRHLKRLI